VLLRPTELSALHRLTSCKFHSARRRWTAKWMRRRLESKWSGNSSIQGSWDVQIRMKMLRQRWLRRHLLDGVGRGGGGAYVICGGRCYFSRIHKRTYFFPFWDTHTHTLTSHPHPIFLRWLRSIVMLLFSMHRKEQQQTSNSGGTKLNNKTNN